jgi:tRNA(fMet)-specific endonuclease VapC
VVTSIVTYEEQTRGWFSRLAKARGVAEQVEIYARLDRHLANFRKLIVLSFDDVAATHFQRLRSQRVRVGTMDLKIASIVLAHGATLVTRNLVDFRRVPDLIVEDWAR